MKTSLKGISFCGIVITTVKNLENMFFEFNYDDVDKINNKVKEEKEKKSCAVCKSKKLKYKEFSPDHNNLYFCSKKCFNAHVKKGYVYRATPLEKI